MDVVVSHLSDLTMLPSYDQVINHQNRSLKVVKVAGANKVGVPHPQYSALTVNDDNDMLPPKLHPLHITCNDYKSSILQVTSSV